MYALEKPFSGRLMIILSLDLKTPIAKVNSLPDLNNFITSSLIEIWVTQPSFALQCVKGIFKTFFLSTWIKGIFFKSTFKGNLTVKTGTSLFSSFNL